MNRPEASTDSEITRRAALGLRKRGESIMDGGPSGTIEWVRYRGRA